MALPLTVRSSGPEGDAEQHGKTRDVSFRGLYFTVGSQYESGSALQFILTLPKEITMAGDVNILCYAEVVRVEPQADAVGVAARIDRYEFLNSPV
jgi:PilZ domain-containing protein